VSEPERSEGLYRSQPGHPSCTLPSGCLTKRAGCFQSGRLHDVDCAIRFLGGERALACARGKASTPSRVSGGTPSAPLITVRHLEASIKVPSSSLPAGLSRGCGPPPSTNHTATEGHLLGTWSEAGSLASCLVPWYHCQAFNSAIYYSQVPSNRRPDDSLRQTWQQDWEARAHVCGGLLFLTTEYRKQMAGIV